MSIGLQKVIGGFLIAVLAVAVTAGLIAGQHATEFLEASAAIAPEHLAVAMRDDAIAARCAIAAESAPLTQALAKGALDCLLTGDAEPLLSKAAPDVRKAAQRRQDQDEKRLSESAQSVEDVYSNASMKAGGAAGVSFRRAAYARGGVSGVSGVAAALGWLAKWEVAALMERDFKSLAMARDIGRSMAEEALRKSQATKRALAPAQEAILGEARLAGWLFNAQAEGWVSAPVSFMIDAESARIWEGYWKTQRPAAYARELTRLSALKGPEAQREMERERAWESYAAGKIAQGAELIGPSDEAELAESEQAWREALKAYELPSSGAGKSAEKGEQKGEQKDAPKKGQIPEAAKAPGVAI